MIAIVIVLCPEMLHNPDMKTPFRLSGLVGWMGRCGVALIALAFCASALADPSKNVVATPKVPGKQNADGDPAGGRQKAILRIYRRVGNSPANRPRERANSNHCVPDASVREFQWRVSGSRIFRRGNALEKARRESLFFSPIHQGTQSTSGLFQRMTPSLLQQCTIAFPAGFHLPNKFARKFSGADLSQCHRHLFVDVLIHNFWSNGEIAPLCGVGNQVAHPCDSCFVDHIDNEF